MEEFKLLRDETVFSEFSPDEISLIFYLLGLAVAPSLSIDELNVLANGLFLMAQVLFTIASQRTLLNDAIDAQKESSKQKDDKDAEGIEIKKLQEQIEKMQQQIREFEGKLAKI